MQAAKAQKSCTSTPARQSVGFQHTQIIAETGKYVMVYVLYLKQYQKNMSVRDTKASDDDNPTFPISNRSMVPQDLHYCLSNFIILYLSNTMSSGISNTSEGN